MEKLRCVIMRGGTSKGVFFHENELPYDLEKRKEVLLRVMGSPDKRQIDGLGGADILTSKVVIIAPPSRKDADVDYIFGQVGITEPEIDFSLICGNLSSAVAPFAIDEGLVRAKEPITKVRIYCPNVDRYLTSEVRVKDGKAVYEGDFRIDGVPGTGSKISLDYSGTAGLITGKLLPTGNRKDIVDIKELGKIEVSIIDASTVVAFIKAAEIGLKGDESPIDIEKEKDLIDLLENIKIACAELANLTGRSPLLPMIAVVQKPVSWVNFVTGKKMKIENVDILSKIYASGMMHKAYPVTGCVATGAAARMKGTVVNEIISEKGKKDDTLIIGHFSGTIPIKAKGSEIDDEFKLEKAIVYRTARRIMEGYVYI
ncbi:MAG: 3-methylitaconate isomerase [Deltaproteobacteria bacterium]|nr:MAG: 3-methylitaconate isomerase [Deltaproteobacteria bacterium]